MFNLLFRFCYLFFSFRFGCAFFSKLESFGLVLFLDFFVFFFIVGKTESCLQKNNLSSFNQVKIWFGYRGILFFSHTISLCFCDVIKLR